MNDALEDIFDKLINLTNDAIEAVQKEDYDKLNLIMNKRKKAVHDIALLKFSKQELRTIYNKSKILELEDELSNCIKGKQVEIKIKLAKLIRANSTVNNYYSRFNKGALIFSKKV